MALLHGATELCTWFASLNLKMCSKNPSIDDNFNFWWKLPYHLHINRPLLSNGNCCLNYINTSLSDWALQFSFIKIENFELLNVTFQLSSKKYYIIGDVLLCISNFRRQILIIETYDVNCNSLINSYIKISFIFKETSLNMRCIFVVWKCIIWWLHYFMNLPLFFFFLPFIYFWQPRTTLVSF